MRGIGDDLVAVADVPQMDIVLVNPRVAVSTPSVFQALGQKNNPRMAEQLPAWASLRDFTDWLSRQRNDLMPPAVEQQTVISEVLDALRDTGCLFAGMSGSGATCFGLFPPDGHSAKAAQKAVLCSGHDHWWCASGRVLP